MAFDALQKLGREPLTAAHVEEWYRQLDAEANDRGAAILAATAVENALQFAITNRLLIHEGQDNHLFGFNSPMGSFENKIRIGYALRIFWHKTKRNLDAIKAVRNAFAHASTPIDFENQKIKAVCRDCIYVPNPFPKETSIPEAEISTISIRRRYIGACENTANLLIFYAMEVRRAAKLPKKSDDDLLIDVIPRPLP